eukprot:SAG31_NODE_3023_length_4780_cov_5.085665_5_plen_106_part_00
MTRCSRERLGIGYFQLVTAGTVTSAEMRLVLHDAEVVGSLTTTEGRVSFAIGTHALKDINYANVRATVRACCMLVLPYTSNVQTVAMGRSAAKLISRTRLWITGW